MSYMSPCLHNNSDRMCDSTECASWYADMLLTIKLLQCVSEIARFHNLWIVPGRAQLPAIFQAPWPCTHHCFISLLIALPTRVLASAYMDSNIYIKSTY